MSLNVHYISKHDMNISIFGNVGYRLGIQTTCIQDSMGEAYMKLAKLAADGGERLWVVKPKFHEAWHIKQYDGEVLKGLVFSII